MHFWRKVFSKKKSGGRIPYLLVVVQDEAQQSQRAASHSLQLTGFPHATCWLAWLSRFSGQSNTKYPRTAWGNRDALEPMKQKRTINLTKKESHGEQNRKAVFTEKNGCFQHLKKDTANSLCNGQTKNMLLYSTVQNTQAALLCISLLDIQSILFPQIKPKLRYTAFVLILTPLPPISSGMISIILLFSLVI